MQVVHRCLPSVCMDAKLAYKRFTFISSEFRRFGIWLLLLIQSLLPDFVKGVGSNHLPINPLSCACVALEKKYFLGFLYYLFAYNQVYPLIRLFF